MGAYPGRVKRDSRTTQNNIKMCYARKFIYLFMSYYIIWVGRLEKFSFTKGQRSKHE